MKNAKKRGKPFTKDRQPPPAAKRVKKKKTRVKEAIGLQSWETLGKYITENGVGKFIKELKKLNGKSYVISHLQAAEYFKPKLTRAEHTGPDGKDLIPQQDLSKLTDAELRTLAKLQSKIGTGKAEPS